MSLQLTSKPKNIPIIIIICIILTMIVRISSNLLRGIVIYSISYIKVFTESHHIFEETLKFIVTFFISSCDTIEYHR